MDKPTTSAAAKAPPFLPGAANGSARRSVLESYEADALEDDPELNAIVQFAARLCGTPMAMVTLVEGERQRFLSRAGIQERETSREVSFCAYTMQHPDILEVMDLEASTTFADNPFVIGPPHMRYYAGQPLISDEGTPLGAICVVDTDARTETLTDLQRQGLAVLAQAVMRRLRAHRDTIRAVRDLEQRELQLHTLADSMPAIVWSTDAEGKFDYFNKGLLQFIGEGHGTGAAFHPEDWERCDAAWKNALATGDTYEVEHRLKHVDGDYRWMLSRAIPVRDSDGQIVRWFGTAVDIDEVHKVSESRDLISKELAHRIKNIFAVVIGLISLESRRLPGHKDFADSLIATLRALGRAHEFVRPVDGDTRESLRGLLDILFAPYGLCRIRISGDETAVSARAATPLALVFHELATNSAKYGALAADEGHVTLQITDSSENLQLVWREHGGQRVEAPAEGEDRTGFGSRLVEMSVTGQLCGSWERKFLPDGLVVELTVSKEAIAP